MVEILAAVIGFLGIALLTLLGWLVRVDRKLTTVCTAVEIRFAANDTHLKEQKEACKDKFETAHNESDGRLTRLENKVFNGG